MLSTDGGPINTGDLWCIAAAVSSGMFILRMEKFSKLHNPAQLSGVTFAAVSALCGVWVGSDYMRDRSMEVMSSVSLGAMSIIDVSKVRYTM